MKKLIAIAITGLCALVISCNCKKDDPQPQARTADQKSYQYRVEAVADLMDDAPISSSVQEDASGNPFIVIQYNPKYIKPVVGYPNFDIKPVIGYPAFAQAYALQSGVVNNACYSQALVLVSKSASYASNPNGLCDYLKDLKKLADDCSMVKGQIDPVINQLSAFTNCN